MWGRKHITEICDCVIKIPEGVSSVDRQGS